MVQANVLEAKNNLSGFVRMIETGQEDCVIIARRNRPVAKIVRYDQPQATRRIGIAKGEELCSDDWDSPEINAEISALFGEAL